MRQLTFVCFLIFTGFTCFTPLEFDGSERHRFVGKVLDDKGVPIANMLYTFIASAGGEEPFYDATLYAGLTNNKGEFSIIISNTNAKDYILYVNRPNLDNYNVDYDQVNPSFSSKAVFVDKNKLMDFELNLGDITVSKGVKFSIDCENNNSKILELISLSNSKTVFDYNNPFQALNAIGAPCEKSKLSLMVPTNEMLYIFLSGSIKNDSLKHYEYFSLSDSIQIFDLPTTYTIK